MFVGVEVSEAVGVGVSVIVTVDEGVEVRVFVEVKVYATDGKAIGKNDDMNGLVSENPTARISATRNRVISRARVPVNQPLPGLRGLSGPNCPVFKKTK